jgi:hypothetical protein
VQIKKEKESQPPPMEFFFFFEKVEKLTKISCGERDQED